MRAELRFYAELKDFLGASNRSGLVVHTFDVPGSVKDAIESRGVPHTEVDVILANGEPVDFTYHVRDGDRIAVYPVFEAFDVSDVVRVRPRPLRDVRFVVDGHLGKLARHLRLIGFDTKWAGSWSDRDLVEISSSENRILLTRDVGLLKHRAVTHGCYVRATNPRDQLIEIVRRLHLTDRMAPFTRCLECNGLLESADPADVASMVPPASRAHYDEYRTCATCERVYWKGSHYRRLNEIVEEARRAEKTQIRPCAR